MRWTSQDEYTIRKGNIRYKMCCPRETQSMIDVKEGYIMKESDRKETIKNIKGVL